MNHIFTLEDGVVKINGIYVGLPIRSSMQMLSEQGFTLADDNPALGVFKGSIAGLGVSSLRIRKASEKVGSILVCTERECTEEEARAVFEQVKSDLHQEPGFDYNGYGVAPKPHEIDHFWDLNEGLVKMQWDGFHSHGFSYKNDDGRDRISISLQGPVVKDEEYWRSEVD